MTDRPDERIRAGFEGLMRRTPPVVDLAAAAPGAAPGRRPRRPHVPALVARPASIAAAALVIAVVVLGAVWLPRREPVPVPRPAVPTATNGCPAVGSGRSLPPGWVAITGGEFLTTLTMTDPTCGWATGPGFVGHTTNSARSFLDVTPLGITARLNPELTALSSLDAWVSVGSAASATVTIYHTANGGMTWTSAHLGPFTSPLADGHTLVVHDSPTGQTAPQIAFSNAMDGVVAVTLWDPGKAQRSAVIEATDDGGATWSLDTHLGQEWARCSWNDIVLTGNQLGLASVTCATPNGYPSRAPGSGRVLLRTTDGGVTWSRTPLEAAAWPPGTRNLRGLSAPGVGSFTIDASGQGVATLTGCANTSPATYVNGCTDQLSTATTTDGGLTWTRTGPVFDALIGAQWLSPTRGVLVGACIQGTSCEGRGPFTTANGGRTWTAHPEPVIPSPAGVDAQQVGAVHWEQVTYVTSGTGYTSWDPVPATFDLFWNAFPIARGTIDSTGYAETTDGGRSFVPFTPLLLVTRSKVANLTTYG